VPRGARAGSSVRLPARYGAGSDRTVRGTSGGVSEPEQTPETEQRLAEELETGRHRAPSEGVPQDLPDDADAEDGHPT
jgi:hypothetical protein